MTGGTAGGVVGLLADLQLRALEAVAAAWETVPSGPAPTITPGDVETTAAPLRVLLAALPGATDTGPLPDGPSVHDLHRLLARASEALETVGEAARRAAVAFAVAGLEVAAEVADSLMTVALALRMLVELEGRALRAP